ncbi:class I SAM-dependent methyltransferase [Nocardioides sp. TF02-7]|uniref:class I SAM-dependent methyltransferase n=1 Tax=Nocardioides sp. TF02-7 TaxID=2917724 RepID=UPI001F052EF7|nr:class I SAM-dependent methyltransferase [Nocardioides sp. TF02-7]UMG94021.1 class I SAM-dependent methyltransferase [Nocardioides sp. TF02-7]
MIAAQCYHWFDHDRALPEIARVLKRGGSLSLVWNTRDERIPWVKRLGRLIGNQDQGAGPGEALESSPYFGPVEQETFKHWQTVNRESIQDLVLSRSNVAVLPAEAREAKLREVLAFYDDFGRGMDGMQLPYVTQCFRAVVGIKPQPRPAAPAAPAADTAGSSSAAAAGTAAEGGRRGRADPARRPRGDRLVVGRGPPDRRRLRDAAHRLPLTRPAR